MKPAILRMGTIITAGWALCTLGGCASAINGTTQTVTFASDPPGATMTLDGREYTVPVTIQVPRKQMHLAVFRKEGYHITEFAVRRRQSPVFMANAAWGILGPIGVLITAATAGADVASGAAWDLEPAAVNATLVPRKPGSSPHTVLGN